MFVRIRFLDWGAPASPLDSQVMEYPEYTHLSQVAKHLLENGFCRSNRRDRNGEQTTFYDEKQLIMPGAILSIVECDAQGYSPHDLECIRECRGRRG